MSSYHLLTKRAYANPYGGLAQGSGTFQMPRGGAPMSQEQMRWATGTGGFTNNRGPVPNHYSNVSPVPQLGAAEWQSAPGAKQLTPPPTGSWFQRNVVDNPWLEGAAGLASFVPAVGGAINGAWQGGRAAYHTAQGNYGKAAEAAAWGAAGFIPGGAAARGVQLGASGVKALRTGNSLKSGIQAGRALAAPAGKITGLASGAAPWAAAGGVSAAATAGTPQAAAAPGYEPVTDLASYGNNMMQQGLNEVRGR